MTFVWPKMLWLLAVTPLLVVSYVALMRRTRSTVRYASLGLIRAALGPGQSIRRHIPPALFLTGIVALLIAAARPSALITLPSQQLTIMLVIDVSLSMRATDVDPSRISAAQVAAKTFIEEQPPNVRMGIVSFGGTASLVQPPTNEREELLAAISRFQLQRGTATGSALVVALSTLFPDDGIDLEAMVFGRAFGRDGKRGTSIEQAQKPKREFRPVPPGSHQSAVIILLSDGRRTTGPDPIEIAKMAADRGVRVFTVGFGTLEGATIGLNGWSAYVRLDEETLKAIAMTTRGEYFHAGTAQDLKKVYEGLTARFVMEKKQTEVGALFAASAALLMTLAAVLSLLWFNRLD